MTIAFLMKQLQEFIEEKLEQVELPDKQKNMVKPKVYKGVLPKLDGKSKVVDYPFVLIKPGTGSFSEEEGKIDIFLLIGTYSIDEDAYLDVINLTERICQALMKQRIINAEYELILPMSWDFYEHETWPKLFSGLELSFKLQGIEREFEEGDMYD